MQSYPVSLAEVYFYLKQHGIATDSQVAAGIGLRESTVRQKLCWLAREGVIEGKGRAPKYYQLKVNPNLQMVNDLQHYRGLAIAALRLRGIEPI